jgi:hypothetical protein
VVAFATTATLVKILTCVRIVGSPHHTHTSCPPCLGLGTRRCRLVFAVTFNCPTPVFLFVSLCACVLCCVPLQFVVAFFVFVCALCPPRLNFPHNIFRRP